MVLTSWMNRSLAMADITRQASSEGVMGISGTGSDFSTEGAIDEPIPSFVDEPPHF